jgi:hypothetical protein
VQFTRVPLMFVRLNDWLPQINWLFVRTVLCCRWKLFSLSVAWNKTVWMSRQSVDSNDFMTSSIGKVNSTIASTACETDAKTFTSTTTPRSMRYDVVDGSSLRHHGHSSPRPRDTAASSSDTKKSVHRRHDIRHHKIPLTDEQKKVCCHWCALHV